MDGIPVVSAQRVGKVYRRPAEDVVALDGVDLEVPPGEFLALVGESGAGKTTLLNLMGCLDRPTSGTLRLLGQDVGALAEKERVEARRRRVGFVFQEFCLLPTLTAEENVALPLLFSRSLERRHRAGELLDRVGLGRRADHLPRELSGGELQRVAIARALVNGPSLLLADEPTGNLDSNRGAQIVALLRELNRTEGLTVVLSTHNRDIAAQADRVVRLADGRVVQPA